MKFLWIPKTNIGFVGDSITADGGYVNRIWEYLLRYYPNKELNFRNFGTPGDNSQHVINRFDYDIKGYNLEQVIIMVGMNDSGLCIYSKKNEESRMHNEHIIRNYEKNINALIDMFETKGVEVILCTPSPYDDTVELDVANDVGRNEILGSFSKVIRDISSRRDLLLIDFWREMTAYNHQFQSINAAFTLCGLDRVHPQEMGHHVMACLFLKTMGYLQEMPEFYTEQGEIFTRFRGIENNLLDEKSQLLTIAIRNKQLLESQLRNMNMIRREKRELGYEQSEFEVFETAYLQTIKGKPWFEFCMSALNLYKTQVDKEGQMKRQLEELIKGVNDTNWVGDKQ